MKREPSHEEGPGRAANPNAKVIALFPPMTGG